MTRNDYFKLDSSFIANNIEELIHLEDYLPISFAEYGVNNKREEFLKSKNLLSTMREMNQLLNEKCDHYEDSVKAVNSVIIEWLDCHPEFEGIISQESFDDYQNMKTNNDYIDFIDLLYDVKLPNEKDIMVEDTSSIRFPDFNKKGECFDKYPNTLLSCYLSYLIK